jgi:hypothetical protein
MNAAKIQRIIDYYDNQTDEEGAAEIERAPLASMPTSWIEVPVELVPRVQKLIAQHRKSA